MPARSKATGTPAIMEPNPSNATLDSLQVQERPSQRFLVRVTSIRKRLIDEDNLCEKYIVDLCRYAGVIPNDEAGQTQITVYQKKAGKGCAEETRIEIFDTQQHQEKI